MGNDVYYIMEQVYNARFVILPRKNRIWHDILYWQVYIKHRTNCIEWRGKMILHFRGSDYRRYLSSTCYNMMDNFLMDRYFTKSNRLNVETRICWWPNKMNSWKMLWWNNTRMMFGILYSNQKERMRYLPNGFAR